MLPDLSSPRIFLSAPPFSGTLGLEQSKLTRGPAGSSPVSMTFALSSTGSRPHLGKGFGGRHQLPQALDKALVHRFE